MAVNHHRADKVINLADHEASDIEDQDCNQQFEREIHQTVGYLGDGVIKREALQSLEGSFARFRSVRHRHYWKIVSL